jgi:hypothetical protein
MALSFLMKPISPGAQDFYWTSILKAGYLSTTTCYLNSQQPLVKEYEGYHLKLLPAYSGFKVAIRVNQKKLRDDSLVYEPFTPLPDKLGIHILFLKKIMPLTAIPIVVSATRFLLFIFFLMMK